MNDFNDEDILHGPTVPRTDKKKSKPQLSSKHKNAPNFSASIELPQKKGYLNQTGKAGKKKLDFHGDADHYNSVEGAERYDDDDFEAQNLQRQMSMTDKESELNSQQLSASEDRNSDYLSDEDEHGNVYSVDGSETS